MGSPTAPPPMSDPWPPPPPTCFSAIPSASAPASPFPATADLFPRSSGATSSVIRGPELRLKASHVVLSCLDRVQPLFTLAAVCVRRTAKSDWLLRRSVCPMGEKERGAFLPSLPRSFLRFVFLPYASLVRFPTGTRPRPLARRRVDRRGRCGGSGRSSFQGMDDGERPTFRARLPPAPGDMNDMLLSANNLGGRYDGAPELFLLQNKRFINEW